MKIIKHVKPTHDCGLEQDEYLAKCADDGILFAVGSILECSCGKRFIKRLPLTWLERAE